MLLAFRSLVITSAILEEIRGKTLYGEASMHMLSRKDLNSAELETVRVSRNHTTIIKANGEVQTHEEATVYMQDLELFVTVQILKDTPAVLSLGKLFEEHGYSYEWASCHKTTFNQQWHKNPLQHGELRTDRCPRIINWFLQLE